jgi:atypical dual specificity phosphatase
MGGAASGLAVRAWLLVKALFRRFITALPAELRFWLSYLAFWPTAGVNRLVCHLWPHRRQLYNRVDDAVVLGSAPFLARDVEALVSREGVRGVLNLCREWGQARGLYERLGVRELRLHVIDYDLPTHEQALQGVAFMRLHALRGESVYVHCKAGRGRSTTLVLCYLTLYGGLSPEAADAKIRRVRPVISRKWHEPVVQRFAAQRERLRREADALVAALAAVAGEGDGGGGSGRRGGAAGSRGRGADAAGSEHRKGGCGGGGGEDDSAETRSLASSASTDEAEAR